MPGHASRRSCHPRSVRRRSRRRRDLGGGLCRRPRGGADDGPSRRRPRRPACGLRTGKLGGGVGMTQIGYGTYVGPGTGEGLELREEIQLTEAAGFDAIFFSEHHGTERYPPSPLALASYALGATTTLRSGPMPLLLPLHDPVRVAEESALLDVVSGGRLVLGLAAGYLPHDFEQIGIPVDERGPRLDEGLDVIHRVWEGKPQAFHGRFSTFSSTGPLTYPPESGRLPVL